MTLTDLQQEALALVERREREAAEQADRQTTADKESRLQAALREVQDQRRAEEQERTRQAHARKAEELGIERRDLEDRIEGHAINLRRGLEKLEALDLEHREATRLAGRPTPSPLHDFISTVSGWISDNLYGSLTVRAIQSPYPHSDKTLAERDKLTP